LSKDLRHYKNRCAKAHASVQKNEASDAFLHACRHPNKQITAFKAYLMAGLDEVVLGKALVIATNIGRLDIVEHVLSVKADVNYAAVGGNCGSCLFRPSIRGKIDIVNRLIEAKINVNARRPSGNTALHMSCLHQHRDVVNALCAALADVNCVNEKKRTPLYICLNRGYGDIAEVLVAAGAEKRR